MLDGSTNQPDPEEVPPEKLSQEAFRLLRTAQSLLNTREPDLAQRLCPGLEPETVPDNSSSSHRSSLASSLPGHEEETLPCNNSQKREPLSLTTASCNSLLRQSLDNTSLRSLNYNNNNSSLTSGLESAFAGGCRTTSPIYNSSSNCPPKSKTPSPPVPETNYQIRSSPPVSSTEDESGFSSMNSFQEVGLPLVSPSPTPSYSISSTHSKQTNSYPETHFPSHNTSHLESSTVQSSSYSPSGFHEVGLPIVENPPNSNRGNMTPNHRRWSSSPAPALTQYSKHNASFCGAGETLRVLWV
ncbi:hypothetical protein C0J52_16643 [Blattella germanica]|nr:hypothetical protein C0J52_16643 [Blattella germanica]